MTRPSPIQHRAVPLLAVWRAAIAPGIDVLSMRAMRIPGRCDTAGDFRPAGGLPMIMGSLWEGSLRYPHGIVVTPCLESHALWDTPYLVVHLMVHETPHGMGILYGSGGRNVGDRRIMARTAKQLMEQGRPHGTRGEPMEVSARGSL
jgi:hypothetical protein